MKCIVTGGAGFIGSNLVDRLVDDGHEVIVFDDMSSGKNRNLNQKARFIEVDISKDYLFTPIEIDKTKEAGDPGYIKLDSIRHLGLDPTELPGYIIQQQAKRLGKDVVGSPAQFRKKQRDALIHQSGGINSPIWQDPALIEAWGLKGKIQWQESQRSALLKKAESSLLYKIYSLGGRL